MSRNVRQKYPPARTPGRAPKPRDYDSSSIDLSDESGYSGVEDVTDSEDDDEDHVFAAEEEHIISASRKRSLVPPRPLMEEDDDADEESEADEDEAEQEADPADDSASWDGIVSDHDEPPADSLATDLLDGIAAIPVERHVRFEGVPDSDSDSTTSETSEINDFFPDIFVEQSALDPSFRREIEDDDETSSNGSFWDFHNGSQELKAQDSDDEGAAQYFDTTPLATPRASKPPTEMSTPVAIPAEVQELDGYESEFASSIWARLVLILRQPMVIPPRKTSRSPSSAKSRSDGLIRSMPLRARTRRRRSRANPASLALAGSTSTDPTTSPSASSIPRPAR